MAISRTYPSAWGIGDKLTSAQQNAIDTALTYALDKRAGYADTLASVVQATGGVGRLIDSMATGPDADWTFNLLAHGASSAAAGIIRIPTLTAARTYRLTASGATMGDRMLFYYEGTGGSASGYVNITNTQGTGIFRLGVRESNDYSYTAQGASAEFIFGQNSQWSLAREDRSPMRAIAFTSSTTWVCPPGVYEILLLGYGGAGGGGGGAGGWQGSAGWAASGGGGGGGALLGIQRVTVTPGHTYTITIGAGGGGGAGASPGIANAGRADSGGNGGTTIFASSTGDALASFLGAGGGGPGGTFYHAGGTSPKGLAYTLGGLPWASPSPTTPTGGWVASGTIFAHAKTLGQGGHSFQGPTALTWGLANAGVGNGSSNYGYTGGARGGGMPCENGSGAAMLGIDIGGIAAFGGGGGGGAAGPGGGGGGGGTGGNWGDGTDGLSAAANSGAGGGGGGAGGTVDFTEGAGANGGSGGSGKLTIILL